MSESDAVLELSPGFEDPDILAWLEAASAHAMDSAPFGIIGIDGRGKVEIYNAYESRAAGLRPERVMARSLFDEVAPCMNNYLVAQRFADEAELDATLPYTLTLRMRPTPVRLRLLQRPGAAHAFLLVERQAAR